MKYRKIELWLATACFAVIFFSRFYQGLSEFGFVIDRAHGDPKMISDTLLPQLAKITCAYAAFLAINFYILPRYWGAQRYLAAIGAIIVVFVATGLIFMVAQSYISSWIYSQYGNAYVSDIKFMSRGFAEASICFFVYGIYLLIRRVIIYQHDLHASKQSLLSQITREATLLAGGWMLILILLLSADIRSFFNTIGSFYLFALPFCFFIYFLNLYWMIPRYRKAGRRAGKIYSLQLLTVSLSIGFIEIAFLQETGPLFSLISYVLFYWFIPLAVTVTVAWRIYLVNEEKYTQLTALKTALGTSDATLRFLRSQINPHFLFNALNTLYGTAIVEHAAKTGEGIQKLGDMMRFMLHENMQESIPLSREIEYLRNYIDLQNLRIDYSENVEIKLNISDTKIALQIAPMLLIPFIENAYKHGISFNNPSYISISLVLERDVLYLDVHNSRHAETSGDPEQSHPGIGLENVKQRLQLLYSKKHELQIRETKDDFFVHLTLQLL
jgi:two-component system LytT family sensor kinase